MPGRDLTGQHFVEHHTQRVDVRSVIDRVRSLHLLRRHVTGSAHDLMSPRQRELFGGPGHKFGQAEVGNLHATL